MTIIGGDAARARVCGGDEGVWQARGCAVCGATFYHQEKLAVFYHGFIASLGGFITHHNHLIAVITVVHCITITVTITIITTTITSTTTTTITTLYRNFLFGSSYLNIVIAQCVSIATLHRANQPAHHATKHTNQYKWRAVQANRTQSGR